MIRYIAKHCHEKETFSATDRQPPRRDLPRPGLNEYRSDLPSSALHPTTAERSHLAFFVLRFVWDETRQRANARSGAFKRLRRTTGWKNSESERRSFKFCMSPLEELKGLSGPSSWQELDFCMHLGVGSTKVLSMLYPSEMFNWTGSFLDQHALRSSMETPLTSSIILDFGTTVTKETQCLKPKMFIPIDDLQP